MTKSITYPAPKDGSVVSIAGDFNDWKPEQMQLSKDGGVYEKELAGLTKEAAEFKYKFVLSTGEWVLEDGRPTVADDQGALNHIVKIEADPLQDALNTASVVGHEAENHGHVATPEHTSIPHDLGSQVIPESVVDNSYPSDDKRDVTSGPGLVDAEDPRLKLGERTSPLAAAESHLNPAAPAFNPAAQPFVPASNPPRNGASFVDARSSHHRQRSQSRTRKSHSRSSSIVSQRHRAGSNTHHEELNPAAHEFKPQFGQPTHHVPHASGYAAALKKPSSPTIKDEFKKPHLPNKSTPPPAQGSTPGADISRPSSSSTTQDERPNSGVSYAAVAKHAPSEAHASTPPTGATKTVSEKSNDSSVSAPAKINKQENKLPQETKFTSDEEKDPQVDESAIASPTDGQPVVTLNGQSPSEETEDTTPLETSHETHEESSDPVSTALPDNLEQKVGENPANEVPITSTINEKSADVTATLRAATSEMSEIVKETGLKASKQVEAAKSAIPVAVKEALEPSPATNTSAHAQVPIETIKLSAAEYDAEQIRLMDEVCIMLDRDDNPIGSISKKDAHLMTNINQGLLHRAFSLFIFNSDKKLLLQQRATEKITFPDMWTNTCCSHPLHISGEVADDLAGSIAGVKRAAQRKVDQELGIPSKDAQPANMTFLTRIHYLAPSDGQWGEHEIDYILVLRSDPEMSINPNEVRDHKWVSQSELREMFQSTDLSYTPWFKLICETFLYEWWDQLDTIETCKDEHLIHRMKLDPELYEKITHSEDVKSTGVNGSSNSLSKAAEAHLPNSVAEIVGNIGETLAAKSGSIIEQAVEAQQDITAHINHALSDPSTKKGAFETSEPAAEDSASAKDLTEPQAITDAGATSRASDASPDVTTSPVEHSLVLDTSEPAAEDSAVPVTTSTPDPIDAEIQESFDATQTEADVAQASQTPDAVLELSPAGQAKIDAQSVPSDDQVSRPDTGRSIRAKQNFFFYIFNSLFGGIFTGFSSMFSKLAFWRKSPHSNEP